MHLYHALLFFSIVQFLSSFDPWDDWGDCEYQLLQRIPRWREYYTADQMKMLLKRLCSMAKSWDMTARLNIPQLNDPRVNLAKNPIQLNLLPHQRLYLSQEQRCNSDGFCMRNFERQAVYMIIQGHLVRIKRQAQPRRKVIRKEYRAMTDQERLNFHTAVLSLKAKITSSGYNAFDLHASMHSAAYAPQAHFGCAFIPFHRIYLLMLEKQLQEVAGDKSLAIPYWDSTLDSTLPVPCDSVIFSETLLGPSNGFVNVGPFANFRSPDGVISRNCRGNRTIRPRDITIFNQFANFSQLCYCNSPFLELVHGAIHTLVNGIMNNLNSASYDPCFWLHHAFIDKLYEDIQVNWKVKYGDPGFRARSCLAKGIDGMEEPMFPFGSRDDRTKQIVGLKNADGLQARFTQEDYEYAPSPNCTSGTCTGSYLYCDGDICKSRIRNGGRCNEYLANLWTSDQINACMDGYQCRMNITLDSYTCQLLVVAEVKDQLRNLTNLTIGGI